MIVSCIEGAVFYFCARKASWTWQVIVSTSFSLALYSYPLIVFRSVFFPAFPFIVLDNMMHGKLQGCRQAQRFLRPFHRAGDRHIGPFLLVVVRVALYIQHKGTQSPQSLASRLVNRLDEFPGKVGKRNFEAVRLVRLQGQEDRRGYTES